MCQDFIILVYNGKQPSKWVVSKFYKFWGITILVCFFLPLYSKVFKLLIFAYFHSVEFQLV